jgi:DNA-binding CsgD family transcriptional regulator
VFNRQRRQPCSLGDSGSVCFGTHPACFGMSPSAERMRPRTSRWTAQPSRTLRSSLADDRSSTKRMCRDRRRMSVYGGGFNRSAQHLLILRDEEVCHGDVADLVHGGAEAELWERWKNGQSAAAISWALERKNKTGVERIVVLGGGIGPAPRRRAFAALRLEEREEISRGIAVGRSIRQIAQSLGRAPSTKHGIVTNAQERPT